MNNTHSFHIPVMGTGFTIDSPIKVAKYGISSVVSLVDDTLIEDMRKYYCEQIGEAYTPITKYDEDYRARRITAYLNLLDLIVKKDFANVQNSAFEPDSEITKYFELLADNSPLKAQYQTMLQKENTETKKELQTKLRAQMRPGSIDVNIMTKLDRNNFATDKTPLPAEFSDALAALRGYAESSLNSAIILSAGINRRLYTYVEKFKDFYADASGFIKKKIVLKVSDYRSSLTQGRFFAKKGLWVSEYRIESGLNCGGHAFATDGFLMGPILEEFKNKKQELIDSIHKLYTSALKTKNKQNFEKPHSVDITAQGGIGTSQENDFLFTWYKVDGTGWGTPFLLVPEATNVDKETLGKLAAATENDLYLSPISPLGVPFNNLRDSLSDLEKMRRVRTDRPGSACPKGHLVSNTEFTEKPICTASRQYQKLKLENLEQSPELRDNPAELKKQWNAVIQKACICHDLAASPLIENKLEKKNLKYFTAVCPGPNMAYFSTIATLTEMVSHIYGRINLLNPDYRPHMFIKELKMYVEYLGKEIKKCAPTPSDKQVEYLNKFRDNLLDGIEYYKKLFPKMIEETESYRAKALEELQLFKKKLEISLAEHKNIFSNPLQKLLPV